MNKQQFIEAMAAKGVEVTEKQAQQLDEYRKLLKEWNEKMNLTAITDDEQIWEKHFFDSVTPFVNTEFETLCDVGSGAGFPGIPVQILWPERKITLVEPLAKRCRFLNEVKDQLNLDNLTVVNERAEDYAKAHRESFDAVSARAVARLSILMELCVPLLKEKGTFIALKGRNGMQELEQAEPAMKALDVVLKDQEAFEREDESGRINFYFEKEKKTDPKYPRPYGTIKKKPLEK